MATAASPLRGLADETNVPNAWQGALRFAPLDLDTLADDISADLGDAGAFPGRVTTGLAMTCLDQVEGTIEAVEAGEITQMSAETILYAAAARVGAGRVSASWGPTRETIR